MLRYKVIPDPVVKREILTKLGEATALLVAAQDAPNRQRGDHSRRYLLQRADAAA